MAVVPLDVDRPLVEERLVQTVELFVNRLLLINDQSFEKLKKGFNADCTSRWNESVKYFIDWKQYLSEIRADFGGHFDHGSARHAIEEMHQKQSASSLL